MLRCAQDFDQSNTKLKRADFEAAFNTLRLDAVVQRNLFARFAKALPKWLAFVERSFLTAEMKEEYRALVVERRGGWSCR